MFRSSTLLTFPILFIICYITSFALSEEFEDGLVDDHIDCGAWADFGECETNYIYMAEHCADSCYHQHLIRAAVLTGKPINVYCESTVGPFTIELHPAWGPWAVERFLKLVGDSWFNESPFFRAIPNYLVQFGVSLDSEVLQRWEDRPPIPDDNVDFKPVNGFRRGMISFAGNGPHSRTDQVFIAFSDNEDIGSEVWEMAFGIVNEEDMTKLDRMFMYGDFPEFGGNGPDPDRLREPGALEFLKIHYKDMDYIKYCHAELPVDAHGKELDWEL